MTVRPMKQDDLKELAQIYVEVYEDFDVGEKWDQESAQKLLKHFFDKQPDMCFVAEKGNQLLGGFLAGVKPWWDGNHLVDAELFVHPKHQKSGVGSQLSKHAYQEAKDKYQATYLDFVTFSGFDFPLSWYKKQGFEVINGWTLISGELQEVLQNLENS